MDDPRGLDPIVLARVLSGEASIAEETLVRQWALSAPSHTAELDELRRAWALARPADHAVDTTAAWRDLSARMQQKAVELPSPTHRRWARRSHVSRWAMASAAGVAAALVGTAVMRGWMAPRTLPVEQPVTTVYAARVGERALVELEDGTQITLAPLSQLRYTRLASGHGAREIHLEGEAVFKVAHDATRPFRVHAAGAVTMDVGTRFGVRAYPREALRVVVSEGQVALGGEDSASSVDPSVAMLPDPAYLRRGDVAIRIDGRTIVSRSQQVDALLDWASGRFTFTHAEFGSLRADFERWYGLRMHVAQPSLLRQRITGQFEHESPLEIVQALARALHATYTRAGADVTFTAR
jgi:transmembrane sensor